MRNILGIIVSYMAIILIIISAKFFQKSGEETSRKYIHIMLSNWWFIAMYFFDNAIWAAIVPASFIIINYISYKKNLIKVMEREENDGLGTVYYSISLFVLAILTFGVWKRPEIGLASTLIMGYGDGLAAVIGKSFKSYEYSINGNKKSVAGSIAMCFVTGLILAVFFASTGVTNWILKTIVISVILTIVEGVSIKGTDNLTVPILSCLLLAFL